MTALLIALAAATAVGAAIRSTWSPCGLSMLSTITPLAETSRGRRWGVTASWFLLGAVLGGATLGIPAMALAAVAGRLELSAGAALGVAAVLALGAVTLDLGLVGRPMPHHRRQVNEVWLDEFRSWVYGLGFGWQIGTGLATYIMTAGVYLTVGLAALTGRPLIALGITVLFGTVRGMAIFLGVRLVDPERLRSFHAWFEGAGPIVRRAVIALQTFVAIAVATGAWALGGTVAAAAAAAGATLVAVRRERVRVDAQSTPRSGERSMVDGRVLADA